MTLEVYTKSMPITVTALREMAPNLYYIDDSPPCQAVQLVAKALGLELNLKCVDLWKDEHLKPEFLKINSQYTLPTLDDNGLLIFESRPIMGYLVDTYGNDDSLYPKDPKKRVVVNSRLYFDQRFADLYYPVMFRKVTYCPQKKKKLDEAYDVLNQFLENSPWVAGDTLTIADMAIAVTVANAIGVTGYNIIPYPNVVKWYDAAKTSLQGFEEIVEAGVQAFNRILAGRKINRVLDELSVLHVLVCMLQIIQILT